jgi:hypothetical protein
VVITDINLGATLNGYDAAAAAHDRWPSVHVVLISGLPVDHTRHLYPRDRYLQKPAIQQAFATYNRGGDESDLTRRTMC